MVALGPLDLMFFPLSRSSLCRFSVLLAGYRGLQSVVARARVFGGRAQDKMKDTEMREGDGEKERKT